MEDSPWCRVASRALAQQQAATGGIGEVGPMDPLKGQVFALQKCGSVREPPFIDKSTEEFRRWGHRLYTLNPLIEDSKKAASA